MTMPMPSRARDRIFWRRKTWDHKHKMEKVEDYEFESPGKLLGDFWDKVELIMSEPAGEI